MSESSGLVARQRVRRIAANDSAINEEPDRNPHSPDADENPAERMLGEDQTKPDGDQHPVADESHPTTDRHPEPQLAHGRHGTRRHILGYVRVSSEEQAASGLGIEAQTAAIHAECDRRGWTVEILADLGRSGKQVNPELRRALDLLQSGQADGLIISKLDRLARSVQHASAIIDAAQMQGWDLVVIDGAIDLTTASGRAMAQMLSVFAELEREMISSRTKDALAARKARGLDNGRKTAIPAGVLRRIVLSRDAGASFGSIAQELTDELYLSPTGLPVWHESTVRRAYATAKAKEAAAA